MMDLQLKGRRAIVLGATRGIGRAIAETLADEGAHVAICARDAKQVRETAKALESRGVKVFGEAVDIADSGALQSFVAQAAVALGGVDIAISNASALNQGNRPEDWQALLNIDILGFVTLAEAALPFLEDAAKAKGDAALVAVSSVSAVLSNRPEAYGPIKAALIHLVKGYARSLAIKRIRANVVSPGSIYFEDGVWGRIEREQPDLFKRTLERNPFKRMGTPREIADAAVFLASPRSSFTTGANMRVDGAISENPNF
jgi:3-oxoacyl-[acyl-carrier protein] reductase